MLRHWVWLTQAPQIGPITAARLLDYFGSPGGVYYADADKLRQAGLSEREVASLSDKDLSAADAILESCFAKDIRIVTLQDSAYPALLREIPDPPPVLYYFGKLPDLSRRAGVGIVGARQASAYGLSAAKRLGYQIGRCGGVVITGLARGIDSLAAEGALTAGAQVIGVLGCGVDVVYPRENRFLYRDVCRNGCILSEYPPQTPPAAAHFPPRNRIISGLSDGVIVVEASEKSGALITAQQALEQGRDVFAVPGTIDNPACAGSNRLLLDGAMVVTCGWDVMQHYENQYRTTVKEFRGGEHTAVTALAEVAAPVLIPEAPPAPKPDLETLRAKLSTDEFAIVQLLRDGQRQIDEIIAETGLPTAKALSCVTLLEVRGYIRRQPGKRYSLAD